MSNGCNPCISCIPVSDPRIPLATTFKFLLGTNVTLLLKFSLYDYQDNSSQGAAPIKSNSVIGTVVEVMPTYVVLMNELPCTGQPSYYTISLSSIIGVTSANLSRNFNCYLKKVSQLPPLCLDRGTPCEGLLKDLKEILRNPSLQNKTIAIVLDGVQVRSFKVSELVLVKNLLVTQQFFVNPLSMIGGFRLEE